MTQEPILTIREALAMPLFSECRLVAGESGVENRINWVHIVDIPDAHFEWQRRGVLLLTAGYGLRESPARQAALVPTLVAQGFAGMVMAVGYYFDAIPEVIRGSADALGFPVIESPRDLLFIEITEAILDRIVNRQYRLLERASEISLQLTQLVLEDANLQGLATTLASLIGRSVTIEDAAFRVIADAQVGPVDEARRLSVERGRSSPELAQRLLDAGIYASLLNKLGPLHLPAMPDLGMTMERLVAPIIVDREIYGYIWIIIESDLEAITPPSELDTRAITHAATVAALILFKDRAVRRAEEAFRGDFLERLLQSPDDAALFGEQARRLNFRADQPHRVLLLAPLLSSGGNPRSLMPAVEILLRESRIPALIAWRGAHLVLVLESGSPDRVAGIAEAILAGLNHPGSQILIGLGSDCQAADLRFDGLRRSFDQASEALRISQMLGRRDGIVDFDELGLLHWLYQLPPQTIAENSYLQAITRLATHDRERGSELLKTLETFLENNGSLVETADRLFIHRNTLLHRLERIKTICQVDIRTAPQRLNLHAAMLAYRLQPSGKRH